VYQDDQLIADWDSLKGKSIFKYLLANQGAPVAKDILMDLFWPDADPEAARRNLHQAIYNLRQTLRRGHPNFVHVQFEDDCYLLNPSTHLWVDSQEFERHVRIGRRLETGQKPGEAIAQYGMAESLYQGDLLEEDLYEDWPTAQRERTRRTYCDIVDRLTEHHVRNGEYNAAIALCQRVLLRDNCHEPAHRRLMRCYLAQGHRHLAVRQYQTCVEILQSELDLAPSRETVMLYESIAKVV
jgi:DNA-binding SARP family transcriptional activator